MDITYIHVQKEGWTYLASVMDLYSRKIIGYAYGTSMTAELAVQAVKNVCLNVRDIGGSSCTVTLEASIRTRHLKNIRRTKESGILSVVREIRMTTPTSSRSILY